MLKATLGYPSRTAAIEALLAQGLPIDDIVDQVGGTANSVHCLIATARNRVTDRKVILPRETIVALAAPAAARGITPAELVLQLLDVLIRDDVFDILLGEPGETDA